jgi:hypothetical protein
MWRKDEARDLWGGLRKDSTKLKHSRISSYPAKQGPNRRLALLDFPFTVGSYERRDTAFLEN